MKIAPCIACILVAVDSAEKAVGSVDQAIFAPDQIWIWWVAAVGWALVAIGTITDQLAA